MVRNSHSMESFELSARYVLIICPGSEGTGEKEAGRDSSWSHEKNEKYRALGISLGRTQSPHRQVWELSRPIAI